MPDVSYAPGALIAVAGDRCLALVEAAPDSAATTWIWQRVAQGTSVEALLVGLLGDGFAGVGGFALLADPVPGQRRLFCRGSVTATVEGGNVSARIDGVGLLTWREYAVASDAERIVLGAPPDGSVLRLPAAAGVLLASCVVIDLTSAASRETIPYDSPSGPYPATVATVRVIAHPEIANADRAIDIGRAIDANRAPDAGRAIEVGPATDAGPAPDVGRVSAAGRVIDAGRETEVAPATKVGRETDVDRATGAIGAIATGCPSVPDQPALSAAVPPGSPSGLIDAVTWAAGPAVAADPSAADASAADSSVVGPGEREFTVRRADPPASGGAETVRPTIRPDLIGPAVPALICPAGHLNPPSDADCRQCGAPLPNDAVVAPRPTLGVLRLSTGGVVTLDRGVVMGRNPRTDFVGFVGDERPHVVRLPGADGDISRSHVRVTLDGWRVLVTDLNSTNGTLVALPGRDPERLRPGEPVPIKPGTVVTLADGIEFRYEAAE